LARIHGRNGVIYFDVVGGGNASNLPFQAKWSLNFVTDTDEVTAFGDANKNYVAGLPDASGDFSGFYDDATNQTYTAAADGISRKFYLYPSSSKTTQYFYGFIIADFKVDAAVSSATAVACSWKAAGPITKLG